MGGMWKRRAHVGLRERDSGRPLLARAGYTKGRRVAGLSSGTGRSVCPSVRYTRLRRRTASARQCAHHRSPRRAMYSQQSHADVAGYSPDWLLWKCERRWPPRSCAALVAHTHPCHTYGDETPTTYRGRLGGGDGVPGGIFLESMNKSATAGSSNGRFEFSREKRI